MVRGIYKENRNFVNKVAKSLNHYIVKKSSVGVSRWVRPVDDGINTFNIFFRTLYKLDKKIEIIESGKRLYFCVNLNECVDERMVGNGYYAESSSFDIDTNTKNIMKEALGVGRINENSIKRLRDFLISNGITQLRGEDLNDLSNMVYVGRLVSNEIDAIIDIVKQFPDFIKLKNFIKSLYSTKIETTRNPGVFPRLDLSLIPLGYIGFKEDDMLMSFPGDRHLSSNPTSMRFYSTIKVNPGEDSKPFNARLDCIAFEAVEYTPFDDWLYLDFKNVNYDKKMFDNTYL